MATVTTYVDPDGTGDYTSLNAWEAGEQTDLVTDGDSHVVKCFSSEGTADTTAVTIAGWITGPSNKLTIQADTGHETGTEWDSTIYRLAANYSSDALLYLNEDYIDCIGIQVQNTSTSNDCVEIGPLRENMLLKNLLIKGGRYGIICGGTSVGNKFFENCIIIDTADDSIRGCGDATSHIYNCTVSGSGDLGINSQNTACPVFNCVVTDCIDNCFQNVSGTYSDYNYSDDGTAPGTNSLTNQSDPFEDASNGDFRIKSDSNAIDAGIGPSSDSDVPQYDIDGTERTGSSCDIGAWEYVSATPSIVPTNYYFTLMQGGL